MEAKLAPQVRVRVFEGDLAQCQEKVNDWFRADESKTREILDVSVSDNAILVVYEVSRSDGNKELWQESAIV